MTYVYRDSHITRLDGLPEGRHYVVEEENGMKKKYASVNTIISHFEPKTAILKWQANVGAEKAEKIRIESSTRGNTVHASVQAHFEGDKENLLQDLQGVDEKMYLCLKPLVDSVSPILTERKIFWDKLDEKTNVRLGFAGSPDSIGYIPHTLFTYKDGTPVLEKEEAVILDWKTKNKWRGVKASTKDGDCYYPLIKYCLQLAAYSAAVNQRTELKFAVKRGFIVAVTATCRKPHVIYLPPENMYWYWTKFQRMLEAYHYHQEFDWLAFCEEADKEGYLGYPVFI